MKKFYTLILSVLALATVSAAYAEDLGTKYNGTITINMGDDPVVLTDQSVYIKSESATTCTFALYDFKLTAEMPEPMGNIVVPNVAITNGENYSQTYAGSVNDIYLTVETPNDIHANADIKATETTSGALTANIAVLWLMDETTQIPISVTFNGAKEQSQGSVATIATSNAKAYGAASAIAITNYTGNAEVYTIAGQLVKSVKVNGLAKVDMPAGLYIVRLGENASKVVVK